MNLSFHGSPYRRRFARCRRPSLVGTLLKRGKNGWTISACGPAVKLDDQLFLFFSEGATDFTGVTEGRESVPSVALFFSVRIA